MRITRVVPSFASEAGDFEILSPLSVLESDSLKKRNRAKKLVKKAKSIQQNKKAASGEKVSVRRSARSKEPVKINYCEDEDSVVCMEGGLSSPASASKEKVKNQKNLRSLNDVLGKKLPKDQNCKTTEGSKLAPMFFERKGLKSSAVITLLDDSSHEGSENSQDDEQFRAKREFLKSGLPESFKKQIAKTTANREAYAQTCASFQPVVHVQQRLMDCSMWTLPWPETLLLGSLREWHHLPSTPVMTLEGSIGHSTVPASRTSRKKVSGLHKEFPESVKDQLLEETRMYDPSFPVERFFTRFLLRYKEYLQTYIAEPENKSQSHKPAALTESMRGKRKRMDECKKAGRLAKKRKPARETDGPLIVVSDDSDSENVKMPITTKSKGVSPSTGLRRRSQRSKQTEDESKPLMLSTSTKVQTASSKLCDPPNSEEITKDSIKEDVLWTEKYQPQHSNDIIGNMASVRKLHSWLKEWKLRADREERRKQHEKKQENGSNDSWFGEDGNEWLEETEDMLCNTLLITGPTGVGKTAAVYACAQELGFKVFEVNCSSQRSGRQILAQLKEATQSHQVDIQGANAHKPTYFNNYSSNNPTKPGTSPRKLNSPRRVVSSPRKPPQSPRGVAIKKGGLAPVSLASFFKIGGKITGKDAGPQNKKAQNNSSKKSAKAGDKSEEPVNAETKPTTEEPGKRTATSLILFEEVDVIFDDDSGFLAAVKTFMNTTKRPVILTTSDPMFSTVFDGHFEEIHFKTPNVVDLTSYLQLLCLVENIRTDRHDLVNVLHWNGCDIRQSILNLQFWVRSGGGQQVPRSILSSECNGKMSTVEGDGVPPCHVGCVESLMGLPNIQQHMEVEDLNTDKPLAKKSLKFWEESGNKGVNFLYSNIEVLLPLPLRLLPKPTFGLQPLSKPEPPSKPVGSEVNLSQQEEHSDDISPVKVSSIMRRKKRLNLDHKNSSLHSDSDSDNEFLSLAKASTVPAEGKDINPAQDQAAQEPLASKAKVRMRKKLSETEIKKSKPVSQCLSSLAEYMDYMSFLDSSLHFKSSNAEGSCRPQTFSSTAAEVKSGMTDEVRLECGHSGKEFESEEIRAVLEGLSFWKCKNEVSTAYNAVQTMEEAIRVEVEEDLTLPIASHRQIFSLSQSSPCDPRVLDIRREVNKTVLTSLSLSTQGNRAAISSDYLPCLRTICKSEKLKEQGKIKRRFMHYLENIQFYLPKCTLQHLASDFP